MVVAPDDERSYYRVSDRMAREIPGVREYITRVLEFADYGPLALVAFITVINGLAEPISKVAAVVAR